MEISKLHVYSEIGKLRSIMLHKPGLELENLTPTIMKRLLFDDIPDARRAEEEYEVYLQILREAGVQTYFTEEVLAEALDMGGVKEAFLDEFLGFTEMKESQREVLKRYFMDFSDSRSMVDALIRGLRKEEAPGRQTELFEDMGGRENPLILDPLCNLYFTRDPFIVLGNSVSVSNMFYPARRRETIMSRTIFNHHPAFAGKVDLHSCHDCETFIEGGDILILNEHIVAIGLSQRTNFKAIQNLARTLFTSEREHKLEHVLAFRIPATRAFMHLDTVFTMLDKDCFVVHPGIEDSLSVVDLTWDGSELQATEVEGCLESLLAKYLKQDHVRLIKCGGGSPIDAEREQWNDGSNTLAIAPGEIIVYDRNHVTNALFEEAGLKLYKLPSSEISRGRGGPHCMSMPLYRDTL